MVCRVSERESVEAGLAWPCCDGGLRCAFITDHIITYSRVCDRTELRASREQQRNPDMISGWICLVSRSGMLLVYRRRRLVLDWLETGSQFMTCQPTRNCSSRKVPLVSLNIYSVNIDQPPDKPHQADFRRACPSSAIMSQISLQYSIHFVPLLSCGAGFVQL